MCCGATAAGIMALNMGKTTIGQYTADARSEVQDPYFQASWTQELEIPPEEYWGEQDPIVPDFEQTAGGTSSGGGETLTDVVNGNGNGNGNNGHGNDADGCDSSNPGNNPNCVDDTTDDDGTPPGQTPGGNGNSGNSGNSGNGNSGNGNSGNGNSGNGNSGNTGNGTVVTTQSSIAIVNSGFESTGHSNGDWSSGVPGWSINANGSADVGDFNPNQWAIDESTVTGSNVAFLYHGGGSNVASMWQTFPEFYTAGDTYEFSVDIGDGAYSFSGDQPYVLNIYAGSTVIGTATGSTGDINALSTVTVTSTVDDASLDGQPITFEIVNPVGNGGDLLVDNVVGTAISQTVVPQTNIVTSPIQGCPDPNYIAPPIETTGDELEDENLNLEVDAGGDTHLSTCQGIPGTGYYTANPSITLDLTDMVDPDFRDFEVRLNSSCDTTLLIRDAEGNWYFDDDSGPGLNSRLRISNLAALNGQVSIWVGTYGSDTCDDVDVRIRVRDD